MMKSDIQLKVAQNSLKVAFLLHLFFFFFPTPSGIYESLPANVQISVLILRPVINSSLLLSEGEGEQHTSISSGRSASVTSINS